MITPYFRIIRPINGDYYGHEHLLDSRYCQERQSLLHSYHIILNDFKKLFDYIELHDSNKSTFSHRIYELFLRVCTEFENNCKGILYANGYSRSGNLNISDYFKINQASKLNEYQVRINVWSPNPWTLVPFSEWSAASFSTLSWYQSYNNVKHDRSSNFHLASLENLVIAIAGLFVVLASQFHYHSFHQYQMTMMTYVDDNDKFCSTQDSVFSLKFPDTWTSSDKYQFAWDDIKVSTNPYRQYQF